LDPLTNADVAAERAVLSAIFQHGIEVFLDVDDVVTASSFTVDAHSHAYRCLHHVLSHEPALRPDPAAALAAAHSLGLAAFYAAPDEVRYLRAVANQPCEARNARSLAAKVRKLQLARDLGAELLAAYGDLSRLTGDEAAAAVVAVVESRVEGFVDRHAGVEASAAPEPLGDGLAAFVEHLALNPVERIGLPTGLPHYDEALGGGLRKGTVNVIGARTGVGKTQVGVNVAVRLATGAGYRWPEWDVVPRVPALYLDTEMGRDDHRFRVLANVANVEVKDIEKGRFALNPDEHARLRDAADRFAAVPYDMRSIAGQPFEETLAVMRRWVRSRVGLGPDGKANDCLIVFDYVKLMDASGLKNLQEYQQLGFMMTGLHNFAVKYGVPILTFVQLNRDGINAEDTSAASGSDRIVWLASNFTIYKPQSEDELAKQTRPGAKFRHKLVPLKSRHGGCLAPGDFIHVKTDYRFGRVSEGPTDHLYDDGSGGFPGGGEADDFSAPPPALPGR
jgi:replicative DNA helicase